MDDLSLAKQLVAAIKSDFPDHKEGTRPIHTIGVGVDGYFEPSDVAKNYCTAEHFVAPRVQVSVRFARAVPSSTMAGPTCAAWRAASTCQAGRRPT